MKIVLPNSAVLPLRYLELLTNIKVFLVLLLLTLQNLHRFVCDLRECIYSIDALKMFQMIFN